MDVQNIIVAIIVIAALGYVGEMLWRRIKSFSPKKKSCATDCGCEGEIKK